MLHHKGSTLRKKSS